MNELFFILEQCFNTINEDNGKAFAKGYISIISQTDDEEEQGKLISQFKHDRLESAKKKADYIDEGTPEAFAFNFINELKRRNKYVKYLDSEYRQLAISYYNLATKAALTQNANTFQRAKSMAAGNGAGSKIKHIPSSEGDLERSSRPQMGKAISFSKYWKWIYW